MRKLDSALFDSVKKDDTSAVLNLLKDGADPNAYETFLFRGYQEYRRGTLHAALRVTDERGFGVEVPENTKLISVLLDYGAEIDARDTSHFTPLRLASLSGKLATACLLLDRGANINAEDEQGQTPLMMAVLSDNLQLVEELLQRGADIDTQSTCGITALMFAVNFLPKAVGRVPILLKHGANTELTDRHGKTALDYVNYRLNAPYAVEVAEMLTKGTF